MKHIIRRFIMTEKEKGQGLVEYALILVLVAVVVIVILSSLGPVIGNVFSRLVSAVDGDLPCEVTLTTGSRFTLSDNILSKAVLTENGFEWGFSGNNTLVYKGGGLPYLNVANFTNKTFIVGVSVARNCTGYANKG